MSQFNEYGSNPFYQNGGGGGGGYLQGGSPYSASGSPGGMRRSEASHSLRPLTIAQLVKATQAHTDAEWMIDDAEIGQITIVGQVVSMQVQTTNCVYSLEDGTGRMEARYWVDAESEKSGKWERIEDGAYVRLTGALKTFGNKRYINATHVRAVNNVHEIYFHILEAITVNLILEKGSPPGAGQTQQAVPTAGPSGTSAYTAQSHSVGVNDQFAQLPALQRSIIKVILDQPPTAEGVHVAAIARAIGGDANKLSNALDQLMDEGIVYSTMDDSHFKVSS